MTIRNRQFFERGSSAAVSRGNMMNRRLIKTMLTAACAVAPLSLMPASPVTAQSITKPTTDLALSIGRGQLVTVPGQLADVFVANEAVADVQVKSTRQLYVFGKAGGQTTVYASNAAGQVIWSANVRVGSNIDSVDQMLGLAMPDAHITATTIGTDTVLLTGTVAAPEDAAEASRLVSAFMGKDSNVISRLKMATPLQVNLQVRIAEVSRSWMRNVGVNLQTLDGSSGFRGGIGQGRAFTSGEWSPAGPVGVGNGVGQAFFTDPVTGEKILGPAVQSVTNGTTIAGMGKLLGLDILGALDLAEQVGLVSTLANPNLTALSGETADFLAGGEYPIPISSGLGTTSIEYKKYGVSLAYTPTVLANGRISLRVRPEVSQLSAQGAVTVAGFSIPALTIRRAETTVELGSGQSFMIAGLLSNDAQNNLSKAPGLGDVPVLGNLFKSTSFSKGESELVIVVTPYLVNPVNANEIKLPTDGFNTPDELRKILGNQMNAPGSPDRPKPMSAPDPAAPAGPAPQVGLIGAPIVSPGQVAALAQSQARDDSEKRKSSKKRQSAHSDVGPGFSLN
jgi:pilus assembly protein CpaC